MAAAARVLCCSVSLLIVLTTQLMSVDATAGLPTAHIVRHLASVLNKHGAAVREKRQAPSQHCIEIIQQIGQDYYFTICSHISQSFSNVTAITPAQAQEFCDYNCPVVLIGAYDKVLAACGPSFLPDRQKFENAKELIYQSCNSSHGVYCLKEWAEPVSTEIPSYTDRYNIQQCASTYKYSKDCPRSCQQGLSAINRGYGCCYRAVSDYDSSSGKGNAFPLKLFATCGVPTPQLCHD